MMNVKSIIGGLIIFGSLQVIPVDRHYPPVISDIKAPPEVKAVLRQSCYDCHSSETNWPWYGKIAPMSWLVTRDVNRGRKELNFSNWNPLKSKKNIAEIYEEAHAGEMPLPLYQIAHPSAKLTVEDLQILKTWAEAAGADH